jgi:hypothetical protein
LVTPDVNASIGPRTLIVVNTDCSTVTRADVIEITAAPKAAPAPAPSPAPARAVRPVRKSETPHR